MPIKIHNVLFDLDGTLAATAPDLASPLKKVLVEHNHASLYLDIVRHLVSLGGMVAIRMAFGIQEGDPNYKEFGRASCTVRV